MHSHDSHCCCHASSHALTGLQRSQLSYEASRARRSTGPSASLVVAAVVGGVGLLAVLATAAVAAFAVAGVIAFTVVCVRSYAQMHVEQSARYRADVVTVRPRRLLSR